jgi:hypothetical protein
MIDNLLKKSLEKLVRSNEYESIIKLYSQVIDKWNSESTIGDNEFETLKKTFIKEGKVQGLKDFFEIIENI